MIRSLLKGGSHSYPLPHTALLLQNSLKALAVCGPLSEALPNPLSQQVRTTFILKRRWPPRLPKVNKRNTKLKSKNFVYDLVEDANIKKKDPVKVILMNSIEGLGSKYEVVEVPPSKARTRLLLPKLAVYASPENLEKYKGMIGETATEDQPSSPYAKRTAEWLSMRVLNIGLNVKNPWKLEPWHIRVAFRKAGIVVPEEAITMPSKPIEGPDPSILGKEFLIKVKINNKEESPVRCRIHHISAIPSEIKRPKPFHWLYMAEPLFPEEGPLLEELARSNKYTLYGKDEEDAYNE